MNNFDAVRAITRRHFWDDYRSPLTCVAFPTFSASASGETIDLGIVETVRLLGPGLTFAVDAGSVTLQWTVIPAAYAYIIYRSTAATGPFSILVAGVVDNSWVDVPPGPGTFFYRATAIEPDYGETEPSNVVTVAV